MKLLPGVWRYQTEPIGQVLDARLYDASGNPVTQLALINPREMARLRGQGEERGPPRRFCWVVEGGAVDGWVDPRADDASTSVIVHPTPGAEFELRLRIFPAEKMI